MFPIVRGEIRGHGKRVHDERMKLIRRSDIERACEVFPQHRSTAELRPMFDDSLGVMIEHEADDLMGANRIRSDIEVHQ